MTATTLAPSRPTATSDGARLLDNWLAIQALNLDRHARSLRPFDHTEFGTGPAAPSPAHVDAVNALVAGLRDKVLASTAEVGHAVEAARSAPAQPVLLRVLDRKQAVTPKVLHVEAVWDFYHDLFTQRLSAFGPRLRALDRVGADCYEAIYLALRRPVPTLLPFCYADSGFSPATFRRGVPLSKLRQHANLFPLVTIPQHRLSNVWALSSILHEVSHNLQADLGLWEVMPGLLRTRLAAHHVPAEVADTFARWHKEIAADLFALVLGGPAAVESLMDVVGRSRRATVVFDPGTVHPTPYLRTFISTALLRRLGLPKLAGGLEAAWGHLYPAGDRELPAAMRSTFPMACEVVVDTMVFTRHPQLGDRSLAELVPFGPAQHAAIEAGGRALAAGRDPTPVPPRLLVSAARAAVDNRLAPPEAITDSFYRALGRR